MPLVRLLTTGTPATQQMAASCLAAIAFISHNRDKIANAGAIKPLLKLIWSETLGTPETASRCLMWLAKNDNYRDDLSDDGKDHSGEASAPAAEASKGDDDGTKIRGGEGRRMAINEAGGVGQIIKMLDGSNLKGSLRLKSGAVGGWEAVRIGVAGAIELQEIFPGSQVDFRIRIGMQEQAAATLADLALDDVDLQDAIIEAGGVKPLLSLVQCGSALSQENAARTIWYLATSKDNQHVLVKHGAITDLVVLVRTGSQIAQEMGAAALSKLAEGYIEECKAAGRTFERKEVPKDANAAKAASGAPATAAAAADADSLEIAAVVESLIAQLESEHEPDVSEAAAKDGVPPPVETEGASPTKSEASPTKSERDESPTKPRSPEREGTDGWRDRLTEISNANGIPPLVRLAELGTPGGQEKAACALWHLAIDPDVQYVISENRGVNPLVGLLAEGNENAQKYASML